MDLKAILLTHSHYDHTNLVKYLLDGFRAQVDMGSEEIKCYKFKCCNLNHVDDLDIIKIGNTEVTCILHQGIQQEECVIHYLIVCLLDILFLLKGEVSAAEVGVP